MLLIGWRLDVFLYFPLSGNLSLSVSGGWGSWQFYSLKRCLKMVLLNIFCLRGYILAIRNYIVCLVQN